MDTITGNWADCLRHDLNEALRLLGEGRVLRIIMALEVIHNDHCHAIVNHYAPDQDHTRTALLCRNLIDVVEQAEADDAGSIVTSEVMPGGATALLAAKLDEVLEALQQVRAELK